jgi:energy-coupling factor transporter ATP-binding protein EcfA2
MPARLNFVERPRVNDRLVEAVRTPGRQVIVYGESGSGKSTLVHKVLERLYPDHLISRCTSRTSYEDLIRDALDQLGQFYNDSAEDKTGGSKATIGLDVSIFRSSLERQISKESLVTSRRVIAPETTAQRLGEFLGVRQLCWIIEDFHRTNGDTKKLMAEVLKVFSDLAASYPTLKIVLTGAVASARDVVQANIDMRNRVAEILVPLMTEPEIREIIDNGSQLLNVTFERAAVDYIESFSNGLPSIAHYVGLHACLTAGVDTKSDKFTRITLDYAKEAIGRYVEESSDSLKSKFSAALKTQRITHIDNPRVILGALAAAKLHGLTEGEILERIRVRHPEYSSATLRRWLLKLCSDDRGNVICFSPDRRFRFSEPVMHTFAQGVLGVEVGNPLALNFSEMIRSATANWAVGRKLEFTDADGLTYIIEEKPSDGGTGY